MELQKGRTVQQLALEEHISAPAPWPVGLDGLLSRMAEAVIAAGTELAGAVDAATGAMRAENADDVARRAAVTRVRRTVWAIRRELLPAVGRVPAGLRARPAHVDCLRRAHALRREADAAMTATSGWWIDLELHAGAVLDA